MGGLKRILFLFILRLLPSISLLSINSICAQDINLTTPLQMQCSNEFITNSDSILNYYYGVAGTGFIGKDEWIGTCEAKYKWGGPWKPIDGYKHTLCGYLAVKKNKKTSLRKNDYHLVSDGDGDMVVYVIPDQAFRWLQFKSLRPAGHYFKDYSLACEIAIREPGNSDSTDAENYFRNISIDSIQYKPVGVYGPWVSDIHHEKSPEIHPVQQMWRVEKKQNDTVEYQLYSFYDNSSRFNDKNDFPDTCYQAPWVTVPLINVFYIPFEISINDNKQFNFDIAIPSSKNINLYPSAENKLRLIIDGKIRLTINKPINNFPKLTLTDICQADESIIHGYITIETSIGKRDADSGGHTFLKMIRSE